MLGDFIGGGDVPMFWPKVKDGEGASVQVRTASQRNREGDVRARLQVSSGVVFLRTNLVFCAFSG